MAGDLNSSSVRWVVGNTSGQDVSGETTTLPVSVKAIASGSAVPTAAPEGAPFYIKTPANNLYAWNGASWLGPYVTTSGA